MISTTNYNALAPDSIIRFRVQSIGTVNISEQTKLIYVISGKGNYMIGDTIYAVHACDYLVINAYQLHYCCYSDPDDPLDLLTLLFPSEFQTEDSISLYHSRQESASHLLALMETMQKEYKYKPPYYKLKLHSCATDFILTLLRSSYNSEEPDTPPVSVSKKEFLVIREALQFIRLHYTKALTVNDISSQISVSNTYLNQLFQKTLHMSPMQYVIWLRMKQATSLFSSSPALSVKEVAKRSGYTDPYHFSKLFKKHLGVTPTEYKAGKRAKKY